VTTGDRPGPGDAIHSTAPDGAATGCLPTGDCLSKVSQANVISGRAVRGLPALRTRASFSPKRGSRLAPSLTTAATDRAKKSPPFSRPGLS
jgi:hypothetical protein